MSPRARKRFGQHFLHERGVIERIIAEIAPSPADHIVEIGGGHGALTLPLAARVGRLDVIEIDRDLAAELAGACKDQPHVSIHVADALEFGFDRLDLQGRLRIVGNLPYNISTPLLFRLLSFRPIVRDMHLMLQKEVVDRMTAQPGGKDYGRLTVMLARWTDIEACFDIGAGAFTPAPKVTSSLARIIVRDRPRFDVADEVKFARVVADLFSMRRKTLARALRGRIAPDAFEKLGIDPRARAETLDPATLARLAADVD
jgi:16S rRNA (adenine1518-N6/adenine1519-N6)-dimethyltransferase